MRGLGWQLLGKAHGGLAGTLGVDVDGRTRSRRCADMLSRGRPSLQPGRPGCPVTARSDFTGGGETGTASCWPVRPGGLVAAGMVEEASSRIAGVSVVVPVYNSATSLPALVERMARRARGLRLSGGADPRE